MDDIINKYNNISNIKSNINNISNNIPNIINKSNEINCIYIKKDKEEIQLLHDYEKENNFCGDYKKLYLEAKEINKKIFEENIKLYIDGNKTKFTYKYKFK